MFTFSVLKCLIQTLTERQLWDSLDLLLNHFTKKCQHHLTLLPYYKRKQSNILETKPLRWLQLLLKSIRSPSWYLPASSAGFLNI